MKNVSNEKWKIPTSISHLAKQITDNRDAILRNAIDYLDGNVINRD